MLRYILTFYYLQREACWTVQVDVKKIQREIAPECNFTKKMYAFELNFSKLDAEERKLSGVLPYLDGTHDVQWLALTDTNVGEYLNNIWHRMGKHVIEVDSRLLRVMQLRSIIN